ncbi:hypothetical protein WCLP8_2780008 [uncultured Gammaproteobacteria bacterium]
MEEALGKSRLHCRDQAKVRHPLAEVLFMVVAATIAAAITEQKGDYILAVKANQHHGRIHRCRKTAWPSPKLGLGAATK